MKQKINTFFRKFFDKTFLKFVLVGIVNTVFGAGIMFIFYNFFHLSYWISSASNYFFGSILSYFLNKYFTFQNKTNHRDTIVKFTVNITVCYLIAYGIAKPLTRFVLSGASVSVQENIAMLVGMCLFVALNYMGQRFLVFVDKSGDDSEMNSDENSDNGSGNASENGSQDDLKSNSDKDSHGDSKNA